MFNLYSEEEIGDRLESKYVNGSVAELTNLKTIKFQVVRTTMSPVLLKTAHLNKHMQLPLKLFIVTTTNCNHLFPILKFTEKRNLNFFFR